MKYLVTGASGFIGRALALLLVSGKNEVVAISREKFILPGAEVVIINDYLDVPRLSEILTGVDCIIHLAGLAHQVNESEVGSEDRYWRANVVVSSNLAQAAILASVRRFIFISSVGVHGNDSAGVPYSESDIPHPVELYAKSKLQAERILKDQFSNSIEIVIVRPPLVYGRGAPGNFPILMKLISRCMFLPFKSICNKRSFLSLDNLLNFILVCALHPKAVGETFLISDGEDVSTPDFVSRIAMALNKRVILFYFPVKILIVIFKLIGKEKTIRSLSGNLQVDISKAKNVLQWVPIISLIEGLQKI
jgi:nucleoside-diphosphate-sugar epimerase